MRIATWNVNGLRAALRKGFAEHVDRLRPDVLLLQEVRAFPEQLPAEWRAPEGWHVHWNPAQKPGYAGTAVLSRTPLEVLGVGIDGDDPEGRVISARINGVRCVSVYLPSGSSGEHRQQVKEAWMVRFYDWMRALQALDEPVVVAGDLNIAHTEQDIWNPKGNAMMSGFLPHERTWFSTLLEQGWTDSLRAHKGPMQGPYTWWSNRGEARAKDRGWRIDYLLANPAAAARLAGAEVHREGGLEVSDHAPVTLDLA
jgi:exodeoxyribonuclease-3